MKFPERSSQRLVIALAIALAIHEIMAAAVPLRQATLRDTPVETISVAKLIKVEHRATPTPRPTPTPVPTPHPVVYTRHIAETHTPTPVVNPGAASENQHVRRVASAHAMVHTHFHTKPVQHVVMGGHGAGSSLTAKAENGGVGPGGNGSGVSGQGQGSGGAPTASEPCGYVEFLPIDQAHVDPATGRVFENVQVVVHFPGNGEQTQPLDYPFVYSDASQDPFEQSRLPDPKFQFPPPDLRAGEPDVVQYVMAHTRSDGTTRLQPCPH